VLQIGTKNGTQNPADEPGIGLSVCHLPPGTSKWNKIEHRLFSLISQDWRGKPLVSQEVIVNLIANTTTKTGLKVRCGLDRNLYPKATKVSDAEFTAITISKNNFHGEPNYTIKPRSPQK
jgi:Rhodopirellula transposase DDE domain